MRASLYREVEHEMARLPVGKIDRREKSSCCMHESSELVDDDAFHDVVGMGADIVVQHTVYRAETMSALRRGPVM
ncbi:hypothetical protein [Mycobacterium asiaticum]|uniref:Uncharacterized protein n=1 Tax=Mycobacterium asiaticum TaxID=1790 RepID=A0A1A3CBV9_MYCAS|nr:hypothetical protein [Mycobacterium asiaticum]OBI84514.1 hypothetical protein A9X01_19415 [Mycobacterium asiaticum]